MSDKVKAIPEGFHTLTPYMCFQNTAEAIEFYKKAFGAEEIMRMTGPDGKSVCHAEVKIGDSIIMMGDENPQDQGMRSPKSLNGTSVGLAIYVKDVDKDFQHAVDTGATVRMPPTDMFWGDRYSKVVDPFGHEWSIATHTEDVPPEELGKRAEAFMAEMSGCAQP